MPEDVQPTGPLILFVDDSPVDRALIQRVLPKFNFQVIVAENGERGISMAQEKKPALILLDVILPRMSGVEVCKRLKTDLQTKSIPVIFFSAIELPKEFINFEEAGAVDFVSKRHAPSEIAARIAKALNITLPSNPQ